MSNTIHGIADDANAEIDRLRRQVETLMAERVTPVVTALAGRAEGAAHAASDAVREKAGQLSDSVKEQPLAAIALAGLAGFLLAAVVRR